MTALELTIVPADDPSTKLSSESDASTAANFVKSACTNPETLSRRLSSAAVVVTAVPPINNLSLTISITAPPAVNNLSALSSHCK